MDTPRRLEQKDIANAVLLSDSAGWNQTPEDWRSLIGLEPDGCFGLDCGQELVATASLVVYDHGLAWLGMVLTHSKFRRQGLARTLVTGALSWAEKRGVRTIKLDATQQGRALYESLGFRGERAIERWSRPGTVTRMPLCAPQSDWRAAARLDSEVFRADRSKLIASLQNRGGLYLCADQSGFAMTRAGARAAYIGPVVARNREVARSMLVDCLAGCGGAPCFWDLFPENSAAVELATEAGFHQERALVRMVRGEDLPQETGQMFGIAGFEFG